MSRFLITTLAGLLISGAAMAQPPASPSPGSPGTPKYQNFWGPANERNNNAQDNNRRGDNQGGNRGAQAAPPAASNGGNNNFRQGDNDRRQDFRNNGGQNDRRGNYGNRNNGQNWGGGGYRNNNNWSSYQRNYRSQQRFRGPTYQRPRGWYGQRWTYGQVLPSLFWTSNYWINNYNSYGLQAPPPGTVWVRDGYDAILIDRYNGQIIQVAYDVYY